MEDNPHSPSQSIIIPLAINSADTGWCQGTDWYKGAHNSLSRLYMSSDPALLCFCFSTLIWATSSQIRRGDERNRMILWRSELGMRDRRQRVSARTASTYSRALTVFSSPRIWAPQIERNANRSRVKHGAISSQSANTKKGKQNKLYT